MCKHSQCKVPNCSIKHGTCHCGCGSKTNLEKVNKAAEGRMRGEPKLYLKGHGTRRSGKLLAIVDAGHDTPCHIWLLATDNDGYALRQINRRLRRVARVILDAPPHLQACHKCDNPPCVNPQHLYLGTPRDNTQDMIKKGRRADIRGERVGTARFTERQVRDIRAAFDRGERQSSIARRFGASPPAIHCIIRRKTWTHI